MNFTFPAGLSQKVNIASVKGIMIMVADKKLKKSIYYSLCTHNLVVTSSNHRFFPIRVI